MPNEPSRIEIIPGGERRRRYSAEHKLVEETMQPGMPVSAVARRHGVSPSLRFKWRPIYVEGGRTAVKADEDVVGSSRVRELEARVRDLGRLLGRRTLEVEVLKEALAARGTELAVAVAATRRFTVKIVADALGVARSNLIAQMPRAPVILRPP